MKGKIVKWLSALVVFSLMFVGASMVVPESAEAHTPTHCWHNTSWVLHKGHVTKATFLYHWNWGGWHWHAVWYEHGWWWDGSRSNICG